MRFVEPLIVDEPEEEEIPDQPEVEEAADPVVIPADPVVIPAVEPEAPADLDAVPDFPGGLFDEPTLF